MQQSRFTTPTPELDRIAYVEIYVANALQAMQFYRLVFGFQPVAFAGLETGMRDRTSYVLEQGHIRFVLSSPLTNDGEISQFLRAHGEGVKDVACIVSDLDRVMTGLAERGATLLGPVGRLSEGGSAIRRATVATPSDLTHTLIESHAASSWMQPGYVRLSNGPSAVSTGLLDIDHVAICVNEGTLDEWVAFYGDLFGFRQAHREDVTTEYSGMSSCVVENGSGLIKFPLVSPAAGKRRSQISEYLRYNDGPGVQHVALVSRDIVASTQALKANSLEFLQVPSAYFDRLPDRLGDFAGDLVTLREFGILVDRDKSGVLMQTFTRPLQPRPTFFVELIQRNGARGFGGGNIRALFEAVESQQALRGNL
jgi:4-hydroxyphenylpyruvate dioxygenase